MLWTRITLARDVHERRVGVIPVILGALPRASYESPVASLQTDRVSRRQAQLATARCGRITTLPDRIDVERDVEDERARRPASSVPLNRCSDVGAPGGAPLIA